MADRNLRIRMLLEAADKATKPLRDLAGGSTKAAKALKATRDRLSELNKVQGNISRFREMKSSLRDTEQQMAKTQARIRELAQKISQTSNPTKKLTRDFEAAKRQGKQLSDQHDRESQALEKMRRSLSDAGVSTRNLANHERRLREEATRAAAAIERQTTQSERAARAASRMARLRAGSDILNRGTHRATNSFATGAMMVGEGVGLVEVLKKPIEAAVDLQDKMAGVRKVAQMESPEIQRMTQDYVRLSEVMPIAADEFADMAEKAAAAGVGRDKHGAAMRDQRQQIEDFTVQAGKMAVAFNITKEEAGTTMMAWREAFQLPLPKLRELGDQVNTLNKYFGGSPAEINEVLERIGSLGGVAGAQAAQIAAMASSLSSLHVAADVSATGLKNVLVQFNAGESATKKLRKAYKAVGLDAVAVAKSMQIDAGGTILDVFTRISRLPKFQQVAELRNMFGKESITAIAPLLANLSGLRERMEKVGNATEYAGSVQKEYNIRNDTTAAKLKIAKNNFQDLAITVGTTLLPAVNRLAIKLGAGARALSEFSGAHPGVVKGIAAIVAGLGGLTALGGVFFILRAGLIGLLIPFQALNAIVPLLPLLGAGLSALAAPFAFLGTAMAAFGAPVIAAVLGVVAAIGLLAGGIYLIYRNWGAVKGFFAGVWAEIHAGAVGGIAGITRLLVDFSPLGLLYRGFAALVNWLGGSMPARLSDAGLAMMQGLVRGITGALGFVNKAITGAADSVVTWFKAKLGIHSPSRVFHGLGGFVMEGLSNGIDASRRAPVERIARVAGAMEAQMRAAPLQTRIGTLSRRVGTALAIGAAMPAAATPAARAPAPVAASAAPRPIEIHIHQQPGQSAQDLAKAVRAEMAAYEREQAAKKRSSYTDTQDWE